MYLLYIPNKDSGESLSQEESDDSTQGHTISSPTFLSFSINVHKGSISIALPVKVKCDEEEVLCSGMYILRYFVCRIPH